jgi:antitoxin component YwqK of YwqJK toxin-antitoxin module
MNNTTQLLLVTYLLLNTLIHAQTIETKKHYYDNGNIRSEISFYKKGDKTVREGKSTFWYETGELKNEIEFKKKQVSWRKIKLLAQWTIEEKG